MLCTPIILALFLFYLLLLFYFGSNPWFLFPYLQFDRQLQTYLVIMSILVYLRWFTLRTKTISSFIYIYTHISFYPRLMMTVDLNFELYVCISCTYLYKNIVRENWGTVEHLATIVSVDLNFSSCELILGFPIGILQLIVLCLDLRCGQEL